MNSGHLVLPLSHMPDYSPILVSFRPGVDADLVKRWAARTARRVHRQAPASTPPPILSAEVPSETTSCPPFREVRHDVVSSPLSGGCDSGPTIGATDQTGAGASGKRHIIEHVVCQDCGAEMVTDHTSAKTKHRRYCDFCCEQRRLEGLTKARAANDR